MRASSKSPAVDSQRGRAMALTMFSAVLISFAGLIMRSMEAALPWQINFYRSAALLGVISALVWLRFGRDFFSVIGNIGMPGLAGGILFGCAGMTFVQAMASTTIANTMFILAGIPFFTALFARIALKEKLSRATLLAMLAATAGLVLMVAEGVAIGAGAGNFYALLTAVFFAAFAVILRSRRRQEMLPTLMISAICILLVSAVMQAGDLAVSMRDMILSFIWGGVLSGVAHGIFVYAARHLAAAEVTLFMMLEFALSPVWVWLFANERPSRWTLVGGALILLSVATRALMELPRARRARAARKAEAAVPPPPS